MWTVPSTEAAWGCWSWYTENIAGTLDSYPSHNITAISLSCIGDHPRYSVIIWDRYESTESFLRPNLCLSIVCHKCKYTAASMYPTDAAFSVNVCSMKGKSGPKVEDRGLALFIAKPRELGTVCETMSRRSILLTSLAYWLAQIKVAD